MGDVIGERLLETLKAHEEKVDEELHRMERLDEDDIEVLRRRRVEQLKKVQAQKEEWRHKGHGEYREIVDQRQFFDELKESKRAVVHFYRPATWRCEIIDRHLYALAPKHLETKFVKVNAEKFPFIVERLRVWMLPTLVLVKEGKTEHSIIGFDELGGSDDFPTEKLEEALLAHGLVLESFCG